MKTIAVFLVLIVILISAKIIISVHELAMVERSNQYYTSVDTGIVRIHE